MLAVILVSFACALLVFLCVNGIGRLAVEKIYMSPESVAARKAEIYADFSRYVTANQIAGSDSEAVARWTGDNDYITILVYQGEDLNARFTGGKAQPSSNMQNYERLQYASQYGKLYPMRFADGVYHIAIGDNTQARENSLNMFTALAIASITFVALLLTYIHHLTRRIIRMSREALEIGAGDLEKEISVTGRDELSMLGHEMDHMRRSVIERMGNERRAWEANSELITAISHDIRTPMTSMIGYLGLLNESDFSDTERSRQFTASAYEKAMELKDLTDELFKYFLVFGKAELEMNMEKLDGLLLLEQLLGEAEFDLTDAGFTIRRMEPESSCLISVDPLYLKRVIDNLVSNIKKYAAKEFPVVFLTELKDGLLSVCVSNHVARAMDRVESTKIGIRTCEKIMTHMGGSFTVTRDETSFAAQFSIPVLPAEFPAE